MRAFANSILWRMQVYGEEGYWGLFTKYYYCDHMQGNKVERTYRMRSAAVATYTHRLFSFKGLRNVSRHLQYRQH
jgi:hypothetical protein